MMHCFYNTTTGHIAKTIMLSLWEAKERNCELTKVGSYYRWIAKTNLDYSF